MATYRQRAWDIAKEAYGYVTTRAAAEAGIPAIELAKLAARGRLRHVAHGIYRFDELPATRFDQFFEAVLRVGDGAFLVGDAVLSLHDLALVNPRRIRVATRRRRRGNLPAWISLEKVDVPDTDVTSFEGIPATTVARALRDAQEYVMTERLLDAIPTAVSEGLVGETEAKRLRRDLMAAVR
ncbi:MAG TPA: type IV toxin-antitoxin system AbiEi family antitoxin domain-containing protein [Acidimicrobiales bacterium]|nr:type IV toxin-antitoxin system AbiEi family antitoxin domain-containing protein [Acidimicrobiales bacterium]